VTTVQNMWDHAKDLADLTSSNFPVDARGIDYANTALRVLHNLIVAAQDDYFRSEQSIALVSGTESYALNSDFMRAIKVFYEPTNGDRRYPVEKYHIDDLRGFKKYPIDAGAINLWYVPKPTVFTALSDTLADIYPVGSEDYIAYTMAIQVLTRQESIEQIREYRVEREMVLQTIMDGMEPRDEEDSEVVDRYSRWGGDRSLFAAAEQRDYRYRIMGTKIYFTQTDWRAG
jgi:hypothetical protein